MNNKIFHIDMDCYFASVEMLLNPSLANVPMAVGGRFHHGVVSSANYIARKRGVKSAMPLYTAKRICPELQIVDSHMETYIQISEEIDEFLNSILKRVEKGSIDEWYIDVSDSEFENWDEFEFAAYIKKSILNKFKLKCSIGNSFTIFLAKTATDLCKPDGFLTLNKNNFYSYLSKVKLEDIVGIGASTVKVLKEEFNIKSVNDILYYKNDIQVKKRLGIAWSKLKFNVQGIETNFVNPNYKRKNLGRSYTIKNYTEYLEFYKLINLMCKNINGNLQRNDYLFKNVNLKIKYKDDTHFSKSLFYETHIDEINFIEVLNLFEQHIQKSTYSNILNLSITANDLVDKNDFKHQLTIFDVNKQQINKLETIMNKVNQRFDKKIVYLLSEQKKSSR